MAVTPEKILSESQLKTLINRLKSERDKALLSIEANPDKMLPRDSRIILEHGLFSLIAMTGLRISEALQLRYGDLGSDYIIIRKEISKNKKTGHVYFGNKTRSLLDNYISIRSAKKNWPDNDYLFPSKSRSGFITRSYAFRRFKYWLNVCGLPNYLSPHSLRHSYATTCLDSGLSLAFVRDQLRHSSIQVTSVYLSVTKENREKVKNLF